MERPEMNPAPSNAATAAELLAAGVEPIVITPANSPENVLQREHATTIAAPAHGAAEATDMQIKLAAVIPALNQANTGSGGRNDAPAHEGAPATNPDTTAPIVVKAPPTQEQLWAAPLFDKLRAAIVEHWNTLPAVAAWVEPTKEQIKERVKLRIVELGLDPTDIDSIIQATSDVNTQVNSARAYASTTDVEKFKKLHGAAIKDLLKGDLEKVVNDLAGLKERTVKAKTDDKKPTDKPAAAEKVNTVAQFAQQSIAWAKANGMEHFIRIDRLAEGGGIKGQWHGRALLPDGGYQEIIFNDKDGSYTLTDRIIPAGTPNAIFTIFGEPGKVFDTGSANVRMGVLTKTDITAKGYAIVDYAMVKADIKERNKAAAA